MRIIPLNRRIDILLDVLYDASDIPQIHRKYVGYIFEEEIESMVETAVDDYMDRQNDPTDDLKDLGDRIERIEEAIGMLTRAFKDV